MPRPSGAEHAYRISLLHFLGAGHHRIGAVTLRPGDHGGPLGGDQHSLLALGCRSAGCGHTLVGQVAGSALQGLADLLQLVDLLIEDMEATLGETWGDLGFDDALPFLEQPDASQLEFFAIAVDAQDEEDLGRLGELIGEIKKREIKIILIADEISPASLHTLMRQGADEFVPYPLPEGELAEAIERLRTAKPAADETDVPDEMRSKLKAKGDRNGVILGIHGMAGGTGASTLATNLAWELATIDKHDPPRVCLMDLDLQFGSVSTYLDLPRRDAIYELWADTDGMDSDSFMQSLLTFEDKLHVFTAPNELLPLDLVDPTDVQRVLELARTNFDYVIVDMPRTIVAWTETVLTASHVYFATTELELRSAQNIQRIKRLLQGEDLPFEKLRFVLNRAPKFTDLSGKSRVKRLAESLGIGIEIQLPDGGLAVRENCDHGVPLGEGAAKNALRKEIVKLATSVHEVNQAAEAG